MDIKLVEKIQKLGLQENEARVYLAALELGRGTVTQISKASELNRTTGYDILERLALYGIIQRIKTGNKKIYVAAPPSSLGKYLEQKKKQAELRLKELDKVMPDLQARHKTSLKPSIKFAEGKKEMEKLYLNVLDSKSTVYSILNLKDYAEFFDEVGTYQSRERDKLGIKENVLCVKNEKSDWWHNKTYKNKKSKMTEYRWVKDDPKYDTAGEINIFDDKVIGLLSRPSENVAFEIQSKTFADFLKMVFEMAWDKNK